MKRWICIFFFALLLTADAKAVELPRELTDAQPEAAGMLKNMDLSSPAGLTGGVETILEQISRQVGTVLRQRLRGAASILLVVVPCGAVDGIALGTVG